MKFRDVIKYLDALADVEIYQTDVYKDKKEEEKIYAGSVLDIPWYIAEMWLDDKCNNFEPISVENNKFIIFVKEFKR